MADVVPWSGSEPLVRQVYDVRAGGITLSATVSRADDGTITVRALDGTTDVVPPRSGAGKTPGAASLYCTSVCTWECTFVCRWVCTTVLAVNVRHLDGVRTARGRLRRRVHRRGL